MINTVTSLAVLNSWSNASVGMGVIPFFTEGWFGRKKTAASDNSWEVSLNEIVNHFTGGESNFGAASSWDFKKIMEHNFKANGANALATTLLLPVAVTVGTKLARKQINFVNRLGAPVMKPLGVKL